jgi:hypothetical protein
MRQLVHSDASKEKSNSIVMFKQSKKNRLLDHQNEGSTVLLKVGNPSPVFMQKHNTRLRLTEHERKGITALRNVGKYLPVYTALYHKRLTFAAKPL